MHEHCVLFQYFFYLTVFVLFDDYMYRYDGTIYLYFATVLYCIRTSYLLPCVVLNGEN